MPCRLRSKSTTQISFEQEPHHHFSSQNEGAMLGCCFALCQPGPFFMLLFFVRLQPSMEIEIGCNYNTMTYHVSLYVYIFIHPHNTYLYLHLCMYNIYTAHFTHAKPSTKKPSQSSEKILVPCFQMPPFP